jgi:hypothetical protein
MFGMRWDGAVSAGNVLTFLGMVGFILGALYRYGVNQTKAMTTVTDAVNNLSAITDGLQKSVAVQNGRLAKVETALAINEEVERRMRAIQSAPV